MERLQSPCAYCRKRPVDPAWRPFCCERCKLADLGTWLSGGYRVPVGPEPETPEDDPSTGSGSFGGGSSNENG